MHDDKDIDAYEYDIEVEAADEIDDLEEEKQGAGHGLYKVTKGVKGQLITRQTNPRPKTAMDDSEYLTEFKIKIGNAATAQALIDAFKKNKNSDSADAGLHILIKEHGFSERLVKSVFSIGQARYSRCKQGAAKKISGGLNGFQITDEHISKLNNFLDQVQSL